MSSFGFRNQTVSGVDPATEEWATRTIGAALEVFASLGPGLPEKAYREAMSYELELRGIPHVCEAPVPILYKGKLVAEGRVDILVAEKLVVELKVIDALGPVHTAQVVAYLSAMNLQLGLLINFNVAVLADGIRRVIRSH